MNAATIQKYKNVTHAGLKLKVRDLVHPYVRRRDAENGCISCPTGKVEQAGHFYAAGHFERLRYNLDNIHGQCLQCNYYKHGNLISYRINLEKKIGPERLEALDREAALSKAERRFKFDRLTLIFIIEEYKQGRPYKP